MRKRILPLLLAVTMGIGTLTACGTDSGEQAAGDRETVTLWSSGSDNVKIQFETQIEAFNALQDDYTAELNFVTSGTGTQSLRDRVIAAVKAGEEETDYDIIDIGEDEVLRYIQEGGDDIFIDIDTSKLSNFDQLKFQSSVAPDKVIPYRGTTVVLAYNSETVPEPPKTTDELYQWIKDNPGKFAYNTPDSGGAGSSFVLTTVYNLLPEEALTSLDEKWADEWGPGLDILIDLHPYMYRSAGNIVYPHKNQGALDLLKDGLIDITPMWADMVLSQKAEGTVPEKIMISQLDPPFTGSTVVLGMPKIGSQSEGAYAFIDYMLSTQAQGIALETMAAIPVVDPATLDPEQTKIIEGLEIKEFRFFSVGDLGTKLNERWAAEVATLPVDVDVP